MKPLLAKLPLINISLLLLPSSHSKHCYWCGQSLKACPQCKGKGTLKDGESCNHCNGAGAMCAVHNIDWE